MAVEVEDDLFEIFEILYFEKNTKIDLKYKKAASVGVKAISVPIHNNIKLSFLLSENNFMDNLSDTNFDISKNQNIYLCVSNNKVFAYFLTEKETPTDQKFQAAFENKVIIIDVSLENIVGLGDLWDGQKIINVI
jgi:hypothetical protein